MKIENNPILNSPFIGYSHHRIILDDSGKPVDYEFLEVNATFEKLTGLKADEIIGKTVKTAIPGIEKGEFDWIGFYGEVALNGGEKEFEQYSEPLKKWYRVHVYSTEKLFFTTMFIDITDSKKKTEELEAFFSVNLDLLCIADLEGNFIKTNEEWGRILGYSTEELNKRKFLEFVHPDDMEATLVAMSNLGKGDDVLNFTNRYKCKNGSYRFIEWRSHPRGNLIFAAARDVTERVMVEKKLSADKKQIDMFFDQSLHGFFMCMLDEPVEWNENTDKKNMIEYVLDHQKMTRVNQAMLDQYGAEEKDFVGITVRELFKHNIEHAKEIWTGLFDKGKWHVETCEQKLDGTPMIIDGDYICLYDDKGRITGHFGVQVDITERKRVEEELRRSEEHHRISFEQSHDAIMILEPPAWKFTSVNSATLKMFGVDDGDVFVQLGLWDVAPEYQPDGQLSSEKANQMIETAIKEGSCYFEWTHRRLDGTEFPTTVLLSRLQKPDKTFLQAIVRDTTEQKRANLEIQLSNNVLLMIAQNKPLADILDALCCFTEEIDSNIRASILLFDAEKNILVQGAAPNLPADYSALMEAGLPIGNNVGSCGTAAFTGKLAIAVDIQNDPKWMPYAAFIEKTRKHNLNACWSLPILSANGEVLGAFANYHRKTGEPTSENLRTLKWATQIAVMAIEKCRIEEKLLQLQQNQNILLDNIQTQIWYLTDETTYGMLNQAHADFNGVKIEDLAFKNLYDIFPKEVVDVCKESNSEVFSSKKTVHTEEWVPHASGEKRLISIVKTPKLRDDGTVEYVVCSAEDITEQKKAQEELRCSEERYKHISEQAPVGMFQFCLSPQGEGSFTYISVGSRSILGIHEEMIIQNWKELHNRIDDDYQELFSTAMQKSAMEITQFDETFVLDSPERGKIWLQVKSDPQRLEDGSTLWTGVFIDVDKEKRAEEDLKNERLRLQNIIYGTNAGTWECNLATGETILNENWASILGYTLDELTPATIDVWVSNIHPDDRVAAQELLGRHIQGEIDFYEHEARMKHKDGHYIWVFGKGKIISRTPEGAPEWMFGTHQDITERKIAEKELKISQEQTTNLNNILKAVLESPQDMAVFALDANFCYTAFTKVHKLVMKNLWGVDIEVGKNMLNYITHKQDRNKAYNNFKKCLKGEHFLLEEEYGDGALRRSYYEIRYSPVIDDNQKVIGLTVFNLDVTERKIAEQKISEAKEQYQSLVKNIPGITYRCKLDKDWTMLFMSDAAFDISGYPVDDFLSNAVRSYESVIHPDDRKYVEENIHAAIKENRHWEAEYRIMHKSGKICWVQEKGSGVFDETGAIVYLDGIILDITDRKEAEGELEKAIEVKANFMSMVSHEMRTPLTVIMHGIKIVLDGSWGELNLDQKKFLFTAEKNVDRLGRLINDVLDIQKFEAGMMKLHQQVQDINTIILDTAKPMIPLAHNKGLHLDMNLDHSIAPVSFDGDKMTQVLTNLINNAIKFTDQGKIVVSSRQQDNGIIVSVADTGHGISEEDLPKLFGKFQQITTGNQRKTGGTGLGLAICKEIVELHGGKIWAESKIQQGTMFLFLLPI